MKNNITNRQLTFIIVLGLTSLSVTQIPKIVAGKAGVGGWVSILITALVFAILALLIVKLNRMFPEKMLYEYSRETVGKFIGTLFSVIYVAYFMIVFVLLNTSLTNTLKTDFLIETPLWVTLFASQAVAAYGAYKGIRTIARIFEIYGMLFLLTIFVLHFTMLFQGKWENILPFYIPSETGKVLSAIRYLILPFLGVEVITVIPLGNGNQKSGRVTFLSVIAVGLMYIFVSETAIMMIGINEIKVYNDADLAAIRLVELPYFEFLRRLDAVYLVFGLMGMHAGLKISYLCITEYLAKLLPKVKRIYLVLVVGVIVFALGLLVLKIAGSTETIKTVITYYGLAVAGLIPFIIFMIAKVKHHAQKST